jgi:LuxR family maltose regulon positive regulatory protein
MGPLTLLSAPAGFGKTQLLAEWAAQSAYPVAWLTLSPEDNDYDRFFRYLSRAFQEVEPRISEAVLDYLRAAASSRLEIATLLINEVSAIPKDLVLVVDEYHALEDPSIRGGFNFLLQNLPPNLHLVIASRGVQSLDLALLRARGQVTELGADDLRLTHEEIGQFFNQTMRLQLVPEAIRVLEERTEGWVIGLQLAALSLRDPSDLTELLRGFQGDAYYLVDFLGQEVLNRQPEDVRQFLLRSAILNALSGPLCEAVTALDAAPGYGTRMLAQLEHLNLFITPLDPQHRWFRFHNLFAEFLRHALAQTHSAELPLLHKRAAAWFEQNGSLDEAFKHGLATGDMDWALKLIDRNIETLLELGDISTLTFWTKKLPREHLHQRPRLGLAYAWGLAASYQLDEARFWLDDVQRTLDARGKEQSPPAVMDSADNLPQPSLGELALVRSLLALLTGDFQQAAEHSRVAVSHLQEGNPFIRSMLSLEESLACVLAGDTSQAIEALQDAAGMARRANNLFALIVATCQLAEMQKLQGHLSQALATLQKARLLAVGPDERPLGLAGIVDNGYGEILRERNHLEEAKKYLERGRQLTQAVWASSSLEAVVSLARLHQSQGEFAESQALMAQAYDLALTAESGQWDEVSITATAARLALQRNDLSASVQWWKKGGISERLESISPERYPYPVYEYLQITQARLHFAVGQDNEDAEDTATLRRALELLQSLLTTVERFKRLASKIEILVLKAMIEDALDEHDQAVDTLLSALALGEPEDYRRIYLDEGPGIADLLVRCRDKQRQTGAYSPSLPYITGLLEACRQEAGVSSAEAAAGMAIRTVGGLEVFLSAREIEVLSLIAQGKSNQEIGRELFLAENTVKRHAYNIYTKLDVKKRTQAVSKARQLGIIP